MTFAIISLYILLVLAAKYSFETLPLDIVNVFVYADLDEMVFMRMFSGYIQFGKVLKLKKV